VCMVLFKSDKGVALQYSEQLIDNSVKQLLF
jgi:hypothetical protein